MADPRPDLPPMPEGWTCRWVRDKDAGCGYWFAQPDGDGEVSVCCFPDGGDTYGNLGGVGLDDLLAVLAHLRALSTRDAGEGER